MEKTKVISIQGISISLMISLAVSLGLYLVRHQPVVSRTLPQFMTTEISLVKPVTQARVESKPVTVIAAPVQPATVAPLPIIPPTIMAQVLPEYPTSLLAQGLSGTTLLSIQVGLSGQPERVEVKQSSGVALFDQAAIKAAELWRFSPAMQGSLAIASCFEVPIRFEVK
jgi:TonB family protein